MAETVQKTIVILIYKQQYAVAALVSRFTRRVVFVRDLCSREFATMSLKIYLKSENDDSNKISFEEFLKLQEIDLQSHKRGNKKISDVIFARKNINFRKPLLHHLLKSNLDPCKKIQGKNYLHQLFIYVKPQDTVVIEIVDMLLNPDVTQAADDFSWTPLVYALCFIGIFNWKRG